MSDEDREARRRARAAWPIVKRALDDPQTEDLRDTTTVEERLAMMWPLALDAWASAGRAVPSYERKDTPGRMIRAPERR